MQLLSEENPNLFLVRLESLNNKGDRNHQYGQNTYYSAKLPSGNGADEYLPFKSSSVPKFTNVFSQ